MTKADGYCTGIRNELIWKTMIVKICKTCIDFTILLLYADERGRKNMDIKKTEIFADKKKLKYILFAAVLTAALILYMFIRGAGTEGDVVELSPADRSAQTEASSEEEVNSAGQEKTEDTVNAQPEYIYVDVGGAVNTPMVVCIPSGSRIFQAIEAAGGRKTDSSVKTLNLAEICQDGQKIYVPTEEEVKEAEASGMVIPEQSGESSGEASSGNEGSVSDHSVSGSEKVNINTAGSEDLQTLAGVGPAIASRIIDYRNTNGSFKSIEEIKNVSGIGEKTYEKFKDQICV